MRIRASALTEAVKAKEVALQRVPGQSLVADGFTKQLGISPFQRFKEALRMERAEKQKKKEKEEDIKVRSLKVGSVARMEKALKFLVACAVCVQVAEGSEEATRIVDDC